MLEVQRERKRINLIQQKNRASMIFFQIECHGLNVNSPHMFIYLNIQYPVDKAVSEELVGIAMLEVIWSDLCVSRSHL